MKLALLVSTGLLAGPTATAHPGHFDLGEGLHHVLVSPAHWPYLIGLLVVAGLLVSAAHRLSIRRARQRGIWRRPNPR